MPPEVVRRELLEALAKEADRAEESTSARSATQAAVDRLLRPSTPGGPDVATRVRAYLANVPPAIAGQGGHNQTLKAAIKVGPGFGLEPEEAFAFLSEWNQGCDPQWSEKDLRRKVAEAYKVESKRGWLLEAENSNRRAKEAKEAEEGSVGPVNGHHNGASSASSASFAREMEEFAKPIVVPVWPEPLADPAYHGLIGLFVRALAPHTESDPVAILAQFLAAFGNVVGRYAYFPVEADKHYGNLFVTLVGQSSKARKGTSWGHVRKWFFDSDPDWAEKRVLSGLSSGEGLIWAVRDPITKHEPIKVKGEVQRYQDVEADPGVADKRILALEPELASPLKVLSREGNTLSALLRRAWDDGNLRTLTKNTPAVATGAHVSIVGHITRDELKRLMNDVEAANGFGNRFLWFCVKRARSLPFGGKASELDLAQPLDWLSQAIKAAQVRGEVKRDAEADTRWEEVYDNLSEGRPGLIGAILGRAEAQVMRLALLYALLDADDRIRLEHLEAALAVWKYAEQSAIYAFGESLGDKDVEAVLEGLQAASPAGLSRTDISVKVFSGHKRAVDINAILSRVLQTNLAHHRGVETDGRTAEVWFSGPAKEAKEAE